MGNYWVGADNFNGGITSLPESFKNLSNLESLSLNNNQITNLPDSIGNLIKLDYLELDENKLTSLPESITNIPYFYYLSMGGNHLYCTDSEANPPQWLIDYCQNFCFGLDAQYCP